MATYSIGQCDCCGELDCTCPIPDDIVAHVSGFTGTDCASWNGDYVVACGGTTICTFADVGDDFRIICLGNCDEGDLGATGWQCSVEKLSVTPNCAGVFDIFGSFSDYCSGGVTDYNPGTSVYSACTCDPGTPALTLDI